MVKGLNTSGGRNRLRFQGLSQRLQGVDIDIVHRVRPRGNHDISMNPTPETGEKGCYLQDELERCKDLETTSSFKKFYYTLWPLVQSLPEVIHHMPVIIEKMLDQMNTSPLDTLPTYFQLLSVLGRDIGDSLFPYFDKIFEVLTILVEKVSFPEGKGGPNPELTGNLFECMSYLLK